jgi:replication fork protection complex subunit Tof1/Swi1
MATQQTPEEAHFAISQLENHLLSICVALGGRDPTTGQYVLGDEVLDCLRDLKRLLRQQQDPSLSAHRMGAPWMLDRLAEWGVLAKDLLPILMTPKRDATSAQDIVDHAHHIGPFTTDKVACAVVEILVPMTWPLDLQSAEGSASNQRHQLLQYKEAFLDPGLFTCLLHLLLGPLAVHYRDRKARQHSTIRLVLLLLRNILAIPDPVVTATSTLDQKRQATLQEELVMAMHREGAYDLLLSIASSLHEEEFNDLSELVLETWYLTFRGRDPHDVLGQGVGVVSV